MLATLFIILDMPEHSNNMRCNSHAKIISTQGLIIPQSLGCHCISPLRVSLIRSGLWLFLSTLENKNIFDFLKSTQNVRHYIDFVCLEPRRP